MGGRARARSPPLQFAGARAALCGLARASILFDPEWSRYRRASAMILGLSLSAFTTLHVIVSLLAIAAGFIVVIGMLGGRRLPGTTAFFLATTVLTSLTGLLFPFSGLLPSHAFAILSLLVLALALAGLYVFRLAGPWRWIYVLGALVALYLNVFVAVVQAFQKVAVLQPLSPTQSEPPFLIAELAVLALFVILGAVALRRFHPALPVNPPGPAPASGGV